MTDDYRLLVEQYAGEIKARIPRATYRVQFHKGFTFKDAVALVPYLDALGVSDLYASPILKAVPGSTHGYDICDPRQLNPELGTEFDFQRLSEALKARGMGLVMDIVPNHMGIGADCNAWWMDVLENGPGSLYAHYFDIDWNPVKPELQNKVLLPVLGDQYGAVLEKGDIQLSYADGAFYVSYGERRLPVSPRSYAAILDKPATYLVMALGEADPHIQELQSILTALSYLPSRQETDAGRLVERQREKEIIKRRLAALDEACTEFRKALDEALRTLNGTLGEPRSFDALDAILEAQSYRLSYWRVAGEEINYRRFFDINTMAALRNELPDVFEATHARIFELLAAGQVTALRIDHPDGLWNPPAYFRLLQERYVKHRIMAQLPEPLSVGEQRELEAAVTAWFDDQLREKGKIEWVLWVVAEKILSEMEPLPLEWAVHGTTGYDFMSLVNSLFVDNANEAALSETFSQFTGRSTNFSRQEYASKKMIMQDSLAGEVNSLAHRFDQLSETNRHTRDFTLNGLLNALREVIACLPIYRTYITSMDTVSPRDVQYVEEAVRDAKRRNPRTPEPVFDYVRDTLLLHNIEQFGEAERQLLLDFVMRLQQVTPPVMAKSVEDTLFYVYNRLVSVNEVGGSPALFGITPEEFAAENVKRCRLWSSAMLATSTHDTKRSEDVRARLNVLSELPAAWDAALETWSRINAEHKQMLDAGPAPSANDEYLLYQTLLGTFTDDPSPAYIDRMVAYMHKATKEAKVATSWTDENTAYDAAIEAFVRALLADDEFIQAFLPLQKQVAFFGQFNSLSQTLLKLTCPGVPDTYRGTEVWDFSLVDPDNRRPVDYGSIKGLLDGLQGDDKAALSDDLMAGSDDGRIKLYVLQTALNFRRDHADLFLSAPYGTVEVAGEKREHVCAFTRMWEGVGVLVVAPRLVAGLVDGELIPPTGAAWGETALKLGAYAGKTARNLFTGEAVALGDDVPLGGLLGRFPVALCAFDATGV